LKKAHDNCNIISPSRMPNVSLSLIFPIRLRLFRRKTFFTVKCLQMQMIYKKTFVFSVFVCILENSLKNILQCLEQRKMKKKKKKLETAIPPPQTTGNPPQTTINNPQTHHHSKTRNPTTGNHRKSTTNHHKQPTNPPSQQNPLHQNQEQTKNKQIKTHKSSQS
jgi:hypothetical protein